jgi:hypothetical protein
MTASRQTCRLTPCQILIGAGTPHMPQNASWAQLHPNPRQVSASSATPLVAETHPPAFATPRFSPDGHLEKAAFRPQAEAGRDYFTATSGSHHVGGSQSGSGGMAGAGHGGSEVDFHLFRSGTPTEGQWRKESHPSCRKGCRLCMERYPAHRHNGRVGTILDRKGLMKAED